MLMFMLVFSSSKVILLATSGGISTTFGLRYGSYDTIWDDNRGTSHKKTHIDVVP
jgi:hypothetical protein